MKIRPDDASMLQMNDWLAELREGGWAAPPGGSAGSGDPRPDAPGEAAGRAGPARPVAPAVPRAQAEAAPHPQAPHPQAPHPQAPHPQAPHVRPAHAGPAVRALIGDQLRMPIMWCEMGSCISWHADPAALGEGDMRARAIGAGWRIDAFGRLACLRCQQTDPGFRASRPVVEWDRYTAMARAARIVTERSDQAARAERPPAALRARRGLRSAPGELHSGPRMASGGPLGTDGGTDDPRIRRGGLPGPMAARW